MNYKYAQALISLKNSDRDQIPEFAADMAQKALEEINVCQAELKQLKKIERQKADLGEDQKVFIRGKMVVKVDTIHRLKRFLLLLHEHRLRKIQSQFWRYGGQLKKSQLNHLSQNEKKFLLQYKKLSNQYIDDLQLELTMDLDPPIDTIVEIRVVNDCGEILQLSEQGVKLEKNSVHLIKRRIVQKLIQKGDVVIIR